MGAAYTFAGIVLKRKTAACVVTIMTLTLVALVSACSDSSDLVDTIPEDMSPYSADTLRTPTVRVESAATVVSEAPEGERTKSQIPSGNETVSDKVIVEASVVTDTDAKPVSSHREESEDTELEYKVDLYLPAETAPLSLDERILRADIIARVTLTSVSTTTPFLSDRDLGTTTAHYVSTLELRFDAHEYLKGSGGDTLAVVLPLSFHDYYSSIEEAIEAASAWLLERDTRWDDREAIIFLQNPIGSQAVSSAGSSSYVFSIFQLGYGYAHDGGTAYAINEHYIDSYSIRSEKNKLWLPATSVPASGASGTVEASYYLEEPPSAGTGASGASGQSAGVSSITLSDMKSRVQAMNTLVEQGEGVTGYRRCLEEKYADVRAIQILGLEGIWSESSMSLSSGLPAGSPFNEGRIFGGVEGEEGAKYPKPLLVGPDQHLFREVVEDNDNDSASFSIVTRINRPLPRGTYEVHFNVQDWFFIPCEYISNSYMRWLINVSAPAGTLHEAFFDPVLDTSTSAVGADSANGVLKPSEFRDTGGATTTIGSLEWKSGAVKMNISPHTALDGQALDFIELDGSVSLSLDAADATTDTANSALSWSVDSQPWEEGDTLMLRIRKGPNRPPVFDDTSAYTFTVSEDAPAWHIIGFISASDPDAGDSVLYYITDGNEADRFQIGSNNGELLVWRSLDYETASSYTLTLEARDGKENGTATATVQINVTDVAE